MKLTWNVSEWCLPSRQSGGGASLWCHIQEAPPRPLWQPAVLWEWRPEEVEEPHRKKMTMWVSQSGLNNKGAVTKNKSGKVWLERVRSNSLKDSQDSYSLSTAPWCPPSGRCWWSWTSCCPAADCPALASWSEAATEQQSHCQKRFGP